MEEENNKYTFLFESVKNKFDYQSDADNSLDGKTSMIIGFNIALLTLYFTISFNNLSGIKILGGVIGALFLITSIVLLFKSNHPRDYLSISVDLKKHEEYFIKSERDLLLQLISDAQYAFDKNSEILNNKIKFYKYAIFFLVLSIPFLLLSKLLNF